MYSLFFKYDCIEELFYRIDKSDQIKIHKKIKQLKNIKKRRHLKHGKNFFVEEAGQYRIIYEVFEDKKRIEIIFIGDHKDYEKFLGIF